MEEEVEGEGTEIDKCGEKAPVLERIERSADNIFLGGKGEIK